MCYRMQSLEVFLNCTVKPLRQRNNLNAETVFSFRFFFSLTPHPPFVCKFIILSRFLTVCFLTPCWKFMAFFFSTFSVAMLHQLTVLHLFVCVNKISLFFCTTLGRVYENKGIILFCFDFVFHPNYMFCLQDWFEVFCLAS